MAHPASLQETECQTFGDELDLCSLQCTITLEHLYMPQVPWLGIIGGDFNGYICSTAGLAITLEKRLGGD